MKSPLIASILLVLAAPAFASPWHPTPVQWRDMHAFSDAYGSCFYRSDPEVVKKACATKDRLGKRLEAHGFCLYGKGGVGRTGKKYFYPGIDSSGTNSHWTRHCYAIHDPDPRY